ncbi:MAG: chemotaxis-specific protein-glutamate methyltransferase CheB [Butyribacter sp.]|nr:chemotaxis-specific protein-glutamate methyltransferase CheB [bacterium]MDY3855244.1 chemotaxis-specific protein-glutamate methyltransferase CheB [Butyribacter sp.]
MKNILVIDDSALMRRVLFDIINADENLRAQHYATNGIEALEILESDVEFSAIVLDINMPKMNGIEFLRELKKRGRKENVLIVSTLAKEGAKETIQALELGAFDFVMKPDSLAEAKGASFTNRLISMLYTATGLSDSVSDDEMPKKAERTKKAVRKHDAVPSMPKTRTKVFKQARKSTGRGAGKLVALACSTGGPKSLQYVIPFLPANLDAAVLLVQHMPEGFTASLSKRLDELSRVTVKEAANGDELSKGTVYLAKGGSQMRLLEKPGKGHSISVTEEAARNGLKPCADIMYESLMGSSFDEIVCVVMTGMGADGTKGILQLKQTNNIYVIAQDAPSCTVYGMPKAIADAGVVDEVVTLKGIADAITKHVGVR